MNSFVEKRLFVVWIALSLISLLQLWFSAAGGQETLAPNATITVGVIAMALVKVRFIVREFMEVRHAPPLLCQLTDAWIGLTAVALLGAYFLA